MKIIKQNILNIERGIICQQVNCQSVMGSGLAKQIRYKWPIVYEIYSKESDKFKNWRMDLLGKCLYVDVAPSLLVANIFGQYDFGSDKKRYTDYCALNNAFHELKGIKSIVKLPIYFPYNFGCDRGGGDWKIVEKMIDKFFLDAIICKL